MSKIILKGGRVVDPSNNFEKNRDVLVENGKIKEIGLDIVSEDAEVIDVTGKIVAPGLVDAHCHLRDPGFTHKEDFITGSRGAAVGGFTTLLVMPNTDPVCDSPLVIEYILAKAKKPGVLVNIFPFCAISKGSKGETLAPMYSAVEAGAIGFSDDGLGVMSADLMRRALQYSQVVNKVVACHEEYKDITGDGVMFDGPVANRLGLIGIPYTSEALMVARDLLLAEEVGGKLHICHVSVKKSVELIRIAKERGIDVTAEVVFHFLNTTENDLLEHPYDTRFKIKPPFASQGDQAALKMGLIDGTIDIICTDHAPHSREEKMQEFDGAAPFGVLGLETALSVVLTELYHGKILSLSEIIGKMTLNPAKRYDLDKGTLNKGKDADIVVIDLDQEWVPDVNKYQSKGRSCPQHGRKLKGKAVLTMVNGKIVMRDGRIV
ncbi:MAG: dihydroorotase [Bacillota bacterium]|jgi:dihydroorotase